MSNNVTLVAEDSLEKGRFYLSLNHFGRAFAHFLVFLELTPDKRESVVKEFTNILFNWTCILEALNQYEDLVKCYLQGMHYFPTNVEILNNFGAHLIKLNEYVEAEKYLSKAIKLDPHYLPAEKNYMTVKLNLVPRWHFKMLNDVKRNELFKNAILNCIHDSNSVLDIGTGSGVLSLFASLSGKVQKIYAVEESVALYKVASDVMKANNVHIEMFCCNSTTLRDYPIADVLIMEIFDTALFGEHVLNTLIHAHHSLLRKNARIVPKSANIYITGIQCHTLYKRHRYANTCHLLNLHDLCLTRAKIENEPYEADNLKFYNYKVVTDTKTLFVDFHNLEQLTRLYSDSDALDTITLTIESNSEAVQAIAIWFDLNLDDDNNKVTTNPLITDNSECWEQAIFYLDHPIKPEEGTVRLKLSTVNDKLQIDVLNRNNCTKCYKASREIIAFLNDANLMNAICDSTKYFDDYLNNGLLQILELNPFPLFSLLMGQLGNVKSNCLIKHECDEIFIRMICNLNQFYNMTFLTESKIEMMLMKQTDKFDVVFLNPISEEGIIYEKYISDIVNYENLLKTNGILLPKEVNVTLKLIESEHLRYYNKVNDDCCGFKIAEYMNKYAVSEQWMVKPHELRYKSLTDQRVTSNIMRNDNEPIEESYELIVKTPGTVDGILYWYCINYINDVTIDTYTSNYYNSACFIVVDQVELDQVYKICVKQHKGLLKLYRLSTLC